MTNLADLTTGQLQRIVAIKEKIEALQGEIDSIAADGGVSSPAAGEAPTKKRRMSRAGRAAIAAAQKARWAKIKGNGTTDSKPEKKVKRKLSAVHKRKLVKALAEARKIRLANLKDAKTTTMPAKKKDGRSSLATRAKQAAAAKARWAKVKAEGETTL